MTRIVTAILPLVCIVACVSQEIGSQLRRFENEAAIKVTKNFSTYDLVPLTPSEKCVLEQSILNDLPIMGDRRIAVVDNTFIVKAYREQYLDLNFGIVKVDGEEQFYLLSIPDLPRHIWDAATLHEIVNDTSYALLGAVTPRKLKTSLITDFFRRPEFKGRSGDDGDAALKRRNAAMIMAEIYAPFYLNYDPFYVNSISVHRFKEIIDNDVKLNRMTNEERYQLAPLVDDALFKIDRETEIFSIYDVGYLIFEYKTDSSSGDLEFNAYILPKRKRHGLSRFEKQTDFVDCLRK